MKIVIKTLSIPERRYSFKEMLEEGGAFLDCDNDLTVARGQARAVCFFSTGVIKVLEEYSEGYGPYTRIPDGQAATVTFTND